MVSTFCLRLACGLVVALLVLSADQVPPRFYRVQFLVALGLLAVAGFFLGDSAALPFWIAWSASLACCMVGSIVWHLEDAPGGRFAIGLAPLLLVACLVVSGFTVPPTAGRGWRVADDLASAAVLGSATTAMLMGHSYLIAPAMTISPLLRLLGALAVALGVRIAIACFALWIWSSQPGSGAPETELLVWLPARWALGLVGPVALGWMAWETARIRSTQSATGILYVVVIVCYLGELTSQLLVERTGLLL